MRSFFPFDKKTICKYIHNYVVKISQIPRVISLDDRISNAPPCKKVLLSLDGTDCPYHGPGRPVDKAHWSHKLNIAALR